ncbi:MAG TPA: type IV secretion system protein [Candidatus Angelobacter sp.]|nr:type IV secretion system protein [Candidatus Angelobacter sp.]
MASPFYFETLLTTALSGLNSGGVTTTMGHIGEGIIVATVLYHVYETWWRGADFNELGTVLVKGMLMVTLLANWDTVFHLGLNAFDAVANTILSHTGGGGDLVKQWMQQARTEWNNNAGAQGLWDLLKGGIAAGISGVFLVVSYIILALAYVIFSLIYLIAGVVLYGLGPLVCALYPSGSLASYTKGYLKGFATWGMWPVLYALFASLMVLIHMDTVTAVENSNGFLGFLVGLGSTLLIGIVSLVLAFAVALIPVLAGSIISGDIGGAISRVAKSAVGIAKGFGKGGGPSGGGGGG